jgi:DNA gyrase inhibitor GyrI
MKKFIMLIISFPLLAVFAGCASYKEAYVMTEPEVFEVKKIPSSRVLATEFQGDYFEGANPLFMRLFNYIRANNVPMTVPVESEFSGKSAMRFYVSPDLAALNLEDQGDVKVLQVPERTVASYGTTGSYSKDNVLEARDKLEGWLKQHPELKPKGKPYAVFWNSPFHLWFMKHYEIHMPVEK